MKRALCVMTVIILALGAYLLMPQAPPDSLAAPPESSGDRKAPSEPAKDAKPEKVVKSETEWKKLLTPQQFEICRKKGTERAFTGQYWNEHRDGEYYCVACNNKLFHAATKFDSGTGWPSFFEASGPNSIATHIDRSHGMVRKEVVCSRCGSHLGHVFGDGPQPTGLRYCMNSVSLKFVPNPKSGEAKTGEAKKDDAKKE